MSAGLDAQSLRDMQETIADALRWHGVGRSKRAKALWALRRLVGCVAEAERREKAAHQTAHIRLLQVEDSTRLWDEARAALADARDALERIAVLQEPHVCSQWAREVLGRLDQESQR